MSTINTNGLNVNYPVPGVNNNSQGFRNNFTNIKQNLDIAAAEITDLQDSVVVKNPIGNAAINNDMANVLIANASTLGFRATTYNLGGDLVGPVLIDMGVADVHYGTLGGNVLLSFGNWAPTGTLSKVTLQLSTSNVSNNYSIQFPSEVLISSDDYGTPILNNFANVANVPTLTFPYDCSELILECYSTDCGNSIYIAPVNRPFQSTQIIQRTPPSTGQQGDVVGTVCVDTGVSQLTVTTTYSNDYMLTSNTSSLYVGMPVVFTAAASGVSTETNITLGNTYYVSNINGSTLFKVSQYANASSNVDLSGNVANMYVNPISYMYVATANFDNTKVAYGRNITSTTEPNVLTLQSASNVSVNCPIVFVGGGSNSSSNIGVTVGQVYYVKSLSVNNITLSKTRNNGVAGPTYEGILSSSNPNVDYDLYYGPDIFKRIPLQPF